jgi:anti-anti-sigma factor
MMASGGSDELILVMADGTERSIQSSGAIIGRRADTDVIIDDPSVSRRHAQVIRRGDAWYVSDIGSRNGTTLNGQPVTREVRLSDGDVLQVGEACLTVRLGSPESGHGRSGPSVGIPTARQHDGSADVNVRSSGAISTDPVLKSVAPRLSISVSEPVAGPEGSSVQLQLRGVLDIETAEQVRRRTNELLQAGAVHYLLDLRDLEYLDSSGLAALVALRRQVTPRGGSVRLQHLQPAVRGIIELTRLDRIFVLE